MKKAFFIIFFAAAIGRLSAQSIKFGIKGGLNESQAVFGGSTVSTSSIAGFNAGVFAELKWSNVSFEPGVFFSEAGYNSYTSGSIQYLISDNYSATATVNLRYLQIPLNLVYTIPTRPFDVFLGAGPYAGIALSGTTQGQENNNGVTTTYPQTPIHFGAKNSFNTTDFGVGCVGGLRFKNGVLFSAGYNFGLSNIANSPGASVKNMVWNVSLGYEFL